MTEVRAPAAVDEDPSGDAIPDVLDDGEAGRGVIRGSALRTIGYIAATLANAIALPFLFRYLGVVDAGRYVTVMSIITILAGIVEVGLAQVTVREYSLASRRRRPTLMGEIVSMRLAMLIGSYAATIAFMVAVGYPGRLVLFASVGAVGIFLENLASSYNVALTTSLRLGWLTVSNVARQLVAAALTVGLVLAHAPLILFFALLIPAGIAQLVVSAATTWRDIPHRPSTDVPAWWALLTRSFTYVAAMAVGFVYFRVPVVLVSLLASAKSTGYFGASFRLVETLSLMTGFVLSAAVPLLTRSAGMDQKRHRHILRRLVEVSLIIGAGLSALTAVGARLTIHVVAGPSFDASVGLLQGLAILLLLRFLNTAWSFALLSVGGYRVLLWANLAAATVGIVVGIVAIARYGAAGGVMSAVSAEAALTLGYAVAVRRKIPAADFPWRTASVAWAAMCVSSAVLLLSLPDPIAVVACGVLFAGIIAVGKAVPAEVMALVPGRPARRPRPHS